ncbi:MAG: hypothetical protein CVT84_08975 [Alphaproteobacteria bacterium HGW-Alphaproteobacteria-6]|nr:MAG: hypothetical protein CVT84_08975 [Alphaproteobacteria bacterium HGW-Alphaproteobacteria-6]
MTAITAPNGPEPKRTGQPRARRQRPAEDRARIRRPGGAAGIRRPTGIAAIRRPTGIAAIRRPGIGRPVATKGNRT